MRSARVAAENRIESYARGADHYVSKPYTPDELFEALDDAEHWRAGVRSHQGTSAGNFRFVTSDEDETHRKLARLRSMLFAGTPLNIHEVRDLEEALRALANDAEAWGRSHGASEIAELSYELKPESVVLTLRDLSGWIRDDDRPVSQLRQGLNSPSRFDEIEETRAEGILTLVKRFKGS